MKQQKLEYNGYKLGDFLTSLINESGLTQTDICNVTEISQSMLSKYKNDLKFPLKRTFKAILDVVSITVPRDKRDAFIAENMATYESIREQYLKTRG